MRRGQCVATVRDESLECIFLHIHIQQRRLSSPPLLAHSRLLLLPQNLRPVQLVRRLFDLHPE